MSRLRFINFGTTPDPPATGKSELYVSSADKKLRQIDDAGLVRKLVASGEIGLNDLTTGLILSLSEGFTGGTQYSLKAGRKTATTDGGGNITVTYGAAFATATDYVFANGVSSSANPVYRIGSWNASSFVAFFNAATQAEDFFWFAIGH